MILLEYILLIGVIACAVAAPCAACLQLWYDLVATACLCLF